MSERRVDFCTVDGMEDGVALISWASEVLGWRCSAHPRLVPFDEWGTARSTSTRTCGVHSSAAGSAMLALAALSGKAGVAHAPRDSAGRSRAVPMLLVCRV